MGGVGGDDCGGGAVAGEAPIAGGVMGGAPNICGAVELGYYGGHGDTGRCGPGHEYFPAGGVGWRNTAELGPGAVPAGMTEPQTVSANSAGYVAPTVPIVAPPVVQAQPDDDLPSLEQRTATRKAYVRMDTRGLMPIPPIPFSFTNNVSDLVQFTSALLDAVSSLHLACDDFHPLSWTKGWEKCIECHVLRAVRPTAPQVTALKSMVSDAFAKGGRLQDSGRSRPGVLQHVIRTLCTPEYSDTCSSHAGIAKIGCPGRNAF